MVRMFICLAITHSVMAEPTYYIDINGISRHKNPPRDYNERNYGLGVTRSTERQNGLVTELSGGMYKNSFNKNSFYGKGNIAKRFRKGDYYADLGLMGGLATGYDTAVRPIGGLAATLGKRGLGRVNLMYAPRTKESNALWMMSLGIPFR